MGDTNLQSRQIWALVRRQHGVVARWQLAQAGLSAKAIHHRIATGRLHRLHRGVYAVGRREVTRHGELMAAVLACGPGAVLSHRSAAELWGVLPRWPGPIHVSVPAHRSVKRTGVVVH